MMDINKSQIDYIYRSCIWGLIEVPDISSYYAPQKTLANE
jgi:hypothetical protein